MGIGALLSYSGLRNYVFAPIDLTAQWMGHGANDSSVLSKIFGVAKDYNQLIDAFEFFTTFKATWIKKTNEKLSASLWYSVKATKVFGWTFCVCESVNYLKLRNIIPLSSERGNLALNWCSAVTGGLSAILSLTVTSISYKEIFQTKNKLPKIVVAMNLVSAWGDISNLALAILNSPVCDKYNLKNAKLYVNTGLTVSKWIGWGINSYLQSIEKKDSKR